MFSSVIFASFKSRPFSAKVCSIFKSKDAYSFNFALYAMLSVNANAQYNKYTGSVKNSVIEYQYSNSTINYMTYCNVCQ